MSDTALLVIDVQVGLIEKDIYQADSLLERIKDLTNRARAAHIPVIYVHHSGGTPKHPLFPDKPGWALHPAIAPLPDEPVIHKREPDSFKDTSLREELDVRGVHKLVVAGMQTQFCVQATSSGRPNLATM
jgi:nicotinamidase-related amidase